MSLAASQRQDQRRRLVLSWNRSGSTTSATAPEARGLADYSPAALPEHQPAVATILPTGLGGLALAAVGLLSIVTAAVGVGVWEAVTGQTVFGHADTRFAETLIAVRRCLDLHSLLSLGGWLGQVCLVVAAAAAIVVRLMRRHRRDDYRGRYRAWGWLAGLFTITACAGQVPLGAVLAAVVSDATGCTLGPAGIGWWVLTAGLLYAAVGFWAVLPLHERACTGVWLSLSYLAWAAAATCSWIGRGREVHLIVGNACWIVGTALAAIAMLAAARTVIREVRGLPARKAARPEAKASPAGPAAVAQRKPAAVATDEDADDAQPRRDDSEDRDPQTGQTLFADSSAGTGADDEAGQCRHLSKAERKRLKKLTRMSRAA